MYEHPRVTSSPAVERLARSRVTALIRKKRIKCQKIKGCSSSRSWRAHFTIAHIHVYRNPISHSPIVHFRRRTPPPAISRRRTARVARTRDRGCPFRRRMHPRSHATLAAHRSADFRRDRQALRSRPPCFRHGSSFRDSHCSTGRDQVRLRVSVRYCRSNKSRSSPAAGRSIRPTAPFGAEHTLQCDPLSAVIPCDASDTRRALVNEMVLRECVYATIASAREY